MNITIPKVGSAASTQTFDVPTTDNGSEFKAIVPVANLNSEVTSTAILTVVGTSEQTSKGVRRVLVKVELPYASLQKCSCDSGSYQVDTANSGEPITIHTVLTLPKQAVRDLNAADGTRDAVFERIVVLKGLLGAIINPTRGTVAGSSGPYNQVVSNKDGAICARFLAKPSDTPLSILVNTDDPFVRGAALLKPFLNTKDYGGMNI